MLKSSPVTPAQRQMVKALTGDLICGLGSIEAARCCQREAWTVLQEAVKVSAELLPITLKADAPFTCRQMKRNKECYGVRCPVHPKHESQLATDPQR